MEIKPLENNELEQLIHTYIEEKTGDNLNQLLNHLTTRRILLPAAVDEKTKKPLPALIKSKEGETFQPVFTSAEQTKAAPNSMGLLNMPYTSVNEMVAKANEQVRGVVINPFSDNLMLRRELILKIQEVEEMKKQGAKQVRMSEEQYVIFERVVFEKNFLPKTLFAQGRDFFRQLEERKAGYLDELFEESYQNKRMYPYLEEDFSVMFLEVSEKLTVARIEFPNRDLGPNVSLRAFLTWDEAKQEARYFTIGLGAEQGSREFGEVNKELKFVSCGEAPVDGAELQRVVELVTM